MYETRGPRDPPMRIMDCNLKPIYIFSLENPHFAFSNYAPIGFYHPVYEMQFNTAQQCYAYMKAREFHDAQMQEAIMNTKFDAQLHKRLSKCVQNYIDDQWTEVRELIMFDLLYFKFDQNPDLRKMLLDTMDGQIAAVNDEARNPDSSYLFWDCGVDITNMDGLRRPDEWRGENKLGKTLEMVRRRIDRVDKRDLKIKLED